MFGRGGGREGISAVDQRAEGKGGGGGGQQRRGHADNNVSRRRGVSEGRRLVAAQVMRGEEEMEDKSSRRCGE